jgi:IS1 family transposase
VLVCEKKSRYGWNPQKGYGRIWGWIALDPRSRLVAGWRIDDQTLEACRAFLGDLKARLATIPLFLTDELGHYEIVLWELYRTTSPPVTGEVPARADRARQVDPALDYARVVKERDGDRVIRVHPDYIYGDPARIARRLKGQKVNTAYVERFNGPLRSANRHLGRKSIAFAKLKEQFEARINIFIAYYNLVRPHSTLTIECGERQVNITPAQAAGLCEAKWSMSELLANPSISL